MLSLAQRHRSRQLIPLQQPENLDRSFNDRNINIQVEHASYVSRIFNQVFFLPFSLDLNTKNGFKNKRIFPLRISQLNSLNARAYSVFKNLNNFILQN